MRSSAIQSKNVNMIKIELDEKSPRRMYRDEALYHLLHLNSPLPLDERPQLLRGKARLPAVPIPPGPGSLQRLLIQINMHHMPEQEHSNGKRRKRRLRAKLMLSEAFNT
jgi:hypothetical protein